MKRNCERAINRHQMGENIEKLTKILITETKNNNNIKSFMDKGYVVNNCMLYSPSNTHL